MCVVYKSIFGLLPIFFILGALSGCSDSGNAPTYIISDGLEEKPPPSHAVPKPDFLRN
jgi:hypothetical protein